MSIQCPLNTVHMYLPVHISIWGICKCSFSCFFLTVAGNQRYEFFVLSDPDPHLKIFDRSGSDSTTFCFIFSQTLLMSIVIMKFGSWTGSGSEVWFRFAFWAGSAALKCNRCELKQSFIINLSGIFIAKPWEISLNFKLFFLFF